MKRIGISKRKTCLHCATIGLPLIRSGLFRKAQATFAPAQNLNPQLCGHGIPPHLRGRWGQIQEGQARGAPNLPEERRVPKRWLHCYTATHTLSPMMYQLFQCSIVIDCHCMMLKIDGVQRMPGKALESRRQGLPSLHMFTSRMHGLRLLFDRCMPLGNLSEDG